MNQQYIISAPIGNVVAPAGAISEQALRDFGAQISVDPVWKEKFAKDDIESVLEYLKTAGYTVVAA